MATITPVYHPLPHTQTLKVAAYVRVSRQNERLEHSFTHQVDYYTNLITRTPNWDMAGIYADHAVTGTSTRNRTGFNTLIQDALEGKINLIITKSISRFARNTLDLLTTIRTLTKAGVGVRFEKENIDTTSQNGELLLTLLASFAQAESEANSANTRWGIIRKWQQGKTHSRHPYGYQFTNGELHIIEEEAHVVRTVFANYLNGISPETTTKQLTHAGYKARNGKPLTAKFLRSLLERPIYTGTVLAQERYRHTIGNKRTRLNDGRFPAYLLEDHHAPIISAQDYEAVQTELARRRASGGRALTPTGGTSALTHHITCGACGSHYHRRTKTRPGKPPRKFWWCYTATQGNGNPCNSHQLEENTLHTLICHALKLPTWNNEEILTHLHSITVNDYQLTLTTTSGNTITLTYPAK